MGLLDSILAGPRADQQGRINRSQAELEYNLRQANELAVLQRRHELEQQAQEAELARISPKSLLQLGIAEKDIPAAQELAMRMMAARAGTAQSGEKLAGVQAKGAEREENARTVFSPNIPYEVAVNRDEGKTAMEKMRLDSRLTQKRNATQQGYSMLNAGLENQFALSRMQKGSDLRINENNDKLGTTGVERRLLAAPILQREIKFENDYNSLLQDHPELADALLEERITGKAYHAAGNGLYNTVTGRTIEGSGSEEVPVFDTSNIGGVTTSKLSGMRRRRRPGGVEAPYISTLRQKKDGSPQGLSPFEGFDPTPYQGGSLEELLRGIPTTPLQPQQPRMMLRNPAF